MALRFLNSGYFAGKVGIGIETPTAPLDVFGVRAGRDWALNNRAVIRLDSNGASIPSDILFGHTAAANETSWTGAYWSLSSRGSSADNKFYFYRASGNPDGASEAIIMTFDPNLNVGIGTTSPAQKLHVAGNLRVTGAYYDSNNAPGTLDQVLTSTATGVAWVDPSTITAEAATLVVIECKNTSGATITKGTPVYQTGTVGATDVIEIAPADALISAGAQPAIGLLQTTLNNNGFGKVVITGEFLNFTTDPIDGVTPTTGDKVFLKSGGGLTLTKPTGEGNGIQNLGLIGKVSGGNAGSITVSSIMRTNDVPNLPTGKIWVGDGNTIVSDTVFLDEPNGRMGIGTTSPSEKLEVNGNIRLGNSPSLLWGSNNLTLKTASSSTIGIFSLAPNSDGTVYAPRFQMLNASSAVGVLIRTDGNSYFNGGNVGIGTTSPGAKLDIVGSSLGIRVKKADLSDVLRVYTQGSGTFMDGGNVHISDDLKIGATLLSNQENTDIDSAAAEVVAQVSTTDYTAAFFDFVVKKGTNVRSGTVYACHNGDTTPLVEFTETSTNDLGDTSDVTLSVDISGGNMRLLATVTSDDWSVKSLIRAI